jgi:hypothetical protein
MDKDILTEPIFRIARNAKIAKIEKQNQSKDTGGTRKIGDLIIGQSNSGAAGKQTTKQRGYRESETEHHKQVRRPQRIWSANCCPARTHPWRGFSWKHRFRRLQPTS